MACPTPKPVARLCCRSSSTTSRTKSWTVPNYLARLNLNDGTVTPLEISGTNVVPHGVIYMP
ncbi:hypothetical protein [Sinomonas humi]|uniref:hypothetical protein n=1 Tax=Sinomonas humi TaxID=1338436 RepID=UPI0012E07420|nr:hypothetical protein [Sinomonas humi]